MNKNYKHFEDNDENKLIYTTVHNEYVSIFSNVTFLIWKYYFFNMKNMQLDKSNWKILGKSVEKADRQFLNGRVYEKFNVTVVVLILLNTNSLSKFLLVLRSRREELDGEIFELLLTFEDFLEFKQLMLNFKAVYFKLMISILEIFKMTFSQLKRKGKAKPLTWAWACAFNRSIWNRKKQTTRNKACQ